MMNAKQDENVAQNDKTWDELVSGRVRLFVLAYCTDELSFLNQTKAYQEAFKKKNQETGENETPSDAVAAACASRLLRKAKVRESIQKLMKLARNETDEKNTQLILRDCATYATYRPSQILNVDGSLKVKDLSELGELEKCITGIVTRPTKGGGWYTEVKLIDRQPYVAMMMKYLNIIRDTTTQINVPIIMLTGKTDVQTWNAQGEVQSNGNSESDRQDDE